MRKKYLAQKNLNQVKEAVDQHAEPPPTPTTPPASKPKQTSSAAKLEQDIDSVFDLEEELTGFRFVDVKLLIDFVSKLCCPHCLKPMGENDRLFRVAETRSSLASNFSFTCQCNQTQSP